jgi:hypothetical protein
MLGTLNSCLGQSTISSASRLLQGTKKANLLFN